MCTARFIFIVSFCSNWNQRRVVQIREVIGPDGETYRPKLWRETQLCEEAIHNSELLRYMLYNHYVKTPEFQPFECNKNWAWTIKKCKRRQFKDKGRKTHQAKKATITLEITLPKTMFETFEACTPNNIWMLKSNLNNTSNSCNLGSQSVAKETTLVKWERMHQHKDTNTNQNYNHNSGCNNTQHLDQVL